MKQYNFAQKEAFGFSPEFAAQSGQDKPKFQLFSDADGKSFGDHMVDLFNWIRSVPGIAFNWIEQLFAQFEDFYNYRGQLIADVLTSIKDVIADGTFTGDLIEGVLDRLAPKWGEAALNWVRVFLPVAIARWASVGEFSEDLLNDIRDVFSNFDDDLDVEGEVIDLGTELVLADEPSVRRRHATQLVEWSLEANKRA